MWIWKTEYRVHLWAPCLIFSIHHEVSMSWQRFYKIWDNIGSCLWSWHGSSPLNHNNHQHIQPFFMLDWSGDSITRSSLQSKNSQRDDQTSMFAQSGPKCQWLTTVYQPTQTQRPLLDNTSKSIQWPRLLQTHQYMYLMSACVYRMQTPKFFFLLFGRS